MIEYRLISEPSADLDVEAAFEWYENERPGLGVEFLDELRASYDRIVDGPLKYQELRSSIRRALLRRFPYAVYFAIDGNSMSSARIAATYVVEFWEEGGGVAVPRGDMDHDVRRPDGCATSRRLPDLRRECDDR